MANGSKIRPADLRGLALLATTGVAGLADLVEALHAAIIRPLRFFGTPTPGRTGGITGMVYRSIRGVNGVVAAGVDALLEQLGPVLGEPASSPRREAVLAAVNGVLGDDLVARNNPLAVPMSLRCKGRAVALESGALGAAFPKPSPKVVMLVHGLCMNDLQWSCNEHDHGAALARDLGYTPLYLHYNTGLHTPVNGRALADLLETLLEQWPLQIENLAIVAHSMGGLVARSAYHYGTASRHGWPRHLRKLVFLGTPHHGAALERGGSWLELFLGATPYTAPFARLGKVRSAGITDLRYGNLLDEDWQGHDRFKRGPDKRRPVPLPEGVQCYTAAGIISSDPDDVKARMLGDGLVPLDSALGRHTERRRHLSFPEAQQAVGSGTNHMDLLASPEIYSWIRSWLLL